MYERTIGNLGPASIAVLHADRPSSQVGVGADLKLSNLTATEITQPENPVANGCGQQAGGDMTDTLVFGGVCERCGRPYLALLFPNGQCQGCFPESTKSTDPGRVIARAHLTDVNRPPS